MNEKNRRRLTEIVSTMLRDGESIDFVCTPNVGTVTVKRQVATAAAVGVLSGGLLMATVRPVTRYAVLTNQRLLLLEGAMSGAPTSKLVAELPRDILTSSRFKSALKATFHVEVAGEVRSLKMEFPFPGRHDARRFAELLAP